MFGGNLFIELLNRMFADIVLAQAHGDHEGLPRLPQNSWNFGKGSGGSSCRIARTGLGKNLCKEELT